MILYHILSYVILYIIISILHVKREEIWCKDVGYNAEGFLCSSIYWEYGIVTYLKNVTFHMVIIAYIK